MDITDKIKSIRETVGVGFVKPDPEKLSKFIDNLHNTSHPQALEYLKKRGLNEETIKFFKLGYDIERNGIAIPIFRDDQLVNIKYRLIDGDTRYTSEPNSETWLFNEPGIGVGKLKGGVLIVEGEFDAMSAWQLGVKNVISPAAGANSFGPWLNALRDIPKIYIGFDSDVPGQKAAETLSERLGEDRTWLIHWPAKDVNELLNTEHPQEALMLAIKDAKRMAHKEFKSLGEIINSLRAGEKFDLESNFVPDVKFRRGWMAVVSGRQNAGKTSYILNIARELAQRGTGVLIMPFERGIESVGERLLHVLSATTQQDMAYWGAADWDALARSAADLPIFFAMPDKEEAPELMAKSKKIFNTEVVIIDHLDYLVRQVSNRSDAIADTLQKLKKMAEDNGIILIVVTHIRKIDMPGTFIAASRKPSIEDLKGSSSLYQDPEVVILLSQTLVPGEIYVDVQKNKGPMTGKKFDFDVATGVFSDHRGTSLDDVWNENE